MATQESINRRSLAAQWLSRLRCLFSFFAISPYSAQAVETGTFSRKMRQIMNLSDMLDRRFILFLNASSRDEAIEELINKLDVEKTLPDPEAFRTAIRNREGLVSTGIGSGVAVPHARMKGYDQFFLAIGILRSQGIDWNAPDQIPVRLVFLIGGPDDQQVEYLQLLSCLTHTIKDAELRKQLLQAANSDDVISLLA